MSGEDDRDRFLELQEKMLDMQRQQIDRDQRTTRGPILRVRSTTLRKMIEHGKALLEDRRPALLEAYAADDLDAFARTLSVASDSLESLHTAHVHELTIDELRSFAKVENLSVLSQIFQNPFRGPFLGGLPLGGSQRVEKKDLPIPTPATSTGSDADADLQPGDPEPAELLRRYDEHEAQLDGRSFVGPPPLKWMLRAQGDPFVVAHWAAIHKAVYAAMKLEPLEKSFFEPPGCCEKHTLQFVRLVEALDGLVTQRAARDDKAPTDKQGPSS